MYRYRKEMAWTSLNEIAETPAEIQPITKRSKKNLFILLGVIFILLVIGGVVWLVQRQQTPIETIIVKRQDLREVVDVSGMVQSEADVVIKAEVNGVVLERRVSENLRVGAGQPLLVIEPTQYALQLRQARVNSQSSEKQALTDMQGAEKNLRELQQRKMSNLKNLRNQVAKAEKNLIFLEAEWQRSRQLWEEKVLPEQQYAQQAEKYQQARLDLKTALDNLKTSELDNTEIVNAQNRIVQAQTALNTARQQGQVNQDLQAHQLKKTTVLAPFAGEITQWQIQKGDYLTPGTPLGRFQDIRDLRLRLGVNELDYPKIKLGQNVEIIFDALPETRFAGKIAWLSQASTADAENIQVFPIKVRFENPDQKIKPGMSGDAKITVALHQQVIAVPIAAVRKKDDYYYVMRLEEDTPQEVKVVPGVITLDEMEIKQGLQVGDRLVVDVPQS